MGCVDVCVCVCVCVDVCVCVYLSQCWNGCVGAKGQLFCLEGSRSLP